MTSITLNTDGTFSRTVQYLGKEDSSETAKGKFIWNDEGSKISISTGTNETQDYKVGENVLFHLDKESDMITGDLADNYKLYKHASGNSGIED